MSSPASPIFPESAGEKAPPVQKVLRRLFLTLFLRGRSSRGLQKEKAPGSIGRKLALTIGLYALFGCVALSLRQSSLFALSSYLHAMTFAFLGMFLASSAGEVLFNKEEADILLHRPIAPGVLLWAKIRVLIEASLWIAIAFNLAGLFVGMWMPDGSVRFLFVHVVSVGMEAMFCAGCVVLCYQLCLRWFGRERLDGLITTAQVVISVGAVLASQILPQLAFRRDVAFSFNWNSWWMLLLPPTWFAGLDDAFAGSMQTSSWLLATVAVAATVAVVWIAFHKLARNYELGLQRLAETVSTKTSQRVGRRWLDRLMNSPPLKWWLGNSVERASFLLAAAYLTRDRDTKLRVYPAIAPIMAMPVIFLVQRIGRDGGSFAGGFDVAFAGSYLGIVPMMGLSLLQYSQQWQASDIFRSAPVTGPASICHGARRAAILLMGAPIAVIFALLVWFTQSDKNNLLLLLPGLIALPVYAQIPCLGGSAVPLSKPTEEAKGASRGLSMMGAMLVSFLVAGLAVWSWTDGWFVWMIFAETIIACILYLLIRRSLKSVRWKSAE